MLVSHRWRFIFVKTQKTAGTSLEIALSKFLGPDDVITPVMQPEKFLRDELGYPNHQNYRLPWREHGLRDIAHFLRRRRRRSKFYGHIQAEVARRHVGAETWDSYFKFCFERNPWDKVLSGHQFLVGVQAPCAPFEEWVLSGAAVHFSDYHRYCVGGRPAMDRICRFENLDAEVDWLAERLGLPERPVLPRAKGGYRKDRRPPAEVYTPETRDRVARDFAAEIELMGYSF